MKAAHTDRWPWPLLSGNTLKGMRSSVQGRDELPRQGWNVSRALRSLDSWTSKVHCLPGFAQMRSAGTHHFLPPVSPHLTYLGFSVLIILVEVTTEPPP